MQIEDRRHYRLAGRRIKGIGAVLATHFFRIARKSADFHNKSLKIRKKCWQNSQKVLDSTALTQVSHE
ncbi:MAG: hypothetical protein CAK88_12725 [Verrucomicrobiia bacterium AMD-G2]|nr:MAG: hypothetical protein CAK88_12725 [Verrucomicrobiae bacterium AMD-G2]